jgi:hypothetical protein
MPRCNIHLPLSEDITGTSIPFSSETVPTVDDRFSTSMQEYIDEKFGKELRIWFHVDEHRRMCNRNIPSGANFSFGALETLPRIDNVKAIVTDTNIPTEISPV